MNIREIQWKNFKSYGNKKQRLSFSKDGSLILLSGPNGSGKCLSPDTEIEVEISDKVKNILIKFLKK